MNKRKIIIIIVAICIFVLFVMILTAYLKIKNLDIQLAQSKGLLQKMRDEAVMLANEKEKITKENERLQADAVSYLGINVKLQNEKEKLQKHLEDAQKLIENKESNLQRVKSRLDEIERNLSIKKSKELENLIKEKKALIKKMSSLNFTLKKERALYHYNLGVAYAQAKLYDDAIMEYEKSLEEKEDNAEAHYNTALIFDTVNSDSESAILHYNKYLELKPDAEDRDEVEAAIGRLK